MKKILFSISIVLVQFTSFTQTSISQQRRDSLDREARKSLNIWFQRQDAESNQLRRQQHIQDSIKYFNLDVDVLNKYIFAEVNRVRKSAGVVELTLFHDDTLTVRCERFANYLVVNNLIGHENKDYDAEIVAGRTASLRSDLKYDDKNEMYSNLAKLFVTQWMNSPAHKSLMLSSSYTKMIIGTAKDFVSNFHQTFGSNVEYSSIGFDLRSVIRLYR